MKNTKILLAYVNHLRQNFSSFLKPSIKISSAIYPAELNGAIVELVISSSENSDDKILALLPSVNEALQLISQKSFGGNLAGFIFSGTNIISEENRIIIIKGDDSDESWDDKAAFSDALKIIYEGRNSGFRR